MAKLTRQFFRNHGWKTGLNMTDGEGVWKATLKLPNSFDGVFIDASVTNALHKDRFTVMGQFSGDGHVNGMFYMYEEEDYYNLLKLIHVTDKFEKENSVFASMSFDK